MTYTLIAYNMNTDVAYAEKRKLHIRQISVEHYDDLKWLVDVIVKSEPATEFGVFKDTHYHELLKSTGDTWELTDQTERKDK